MESSEQVAKRRRQIAFFAVLVTQLMIVLDMAIVNVALKAIKDDLGFDRQSLTWVSNAYAIAYGGFLLLASRLGDVYGRRRVLLAGLTIFTGASVVCGFASSPEMLVVGRFIQGLGGAACSGVALAALIAMFPGQDERAKAMSYYILVSVSGGSIGLLLGGFLTEYRSWHWIFFVNVPIGIAIITMILRSLPKQELSEGKKGVDGPGAVLITASAMLITYAIVNTHDEGAGGGHALEAAILGLILGAVFFAWQRAAKNPLLDLQILKVRSLLGSSLIRAILAAAMFSSFYIGSLYFADQRGFSPIQVGLAFLPHTIAAAIMSQGVAAWMIRNLGPLRTLVVGILTAAVGTFLLSRVNPGDPYAPLFPLGFALNGFGISTAMTALLTLALVDVEESQAGVASAIVNVSMQLAGAIGMAAYGTLATSETARQLAKGLSNDEAGSLGYTYALNFTLVSIMLSIPLAVWILGPASRKVKTVAAAEAAATSG